MALKSIGSGTKLFYKIGEVCQMCQIEPHVLRYWESEFGVLSPAKNRAGQRIYREKDVEIVQSIRQLLYEEGYTIAGARKKLAEKGAGKGLPLFNEPARASQKTTLAQVRGILEEILDLTEE